MPRAFLKTAEWRAIRQRVLATNPLCVTCQRVGRVRPAKHVDHIVDSHGDPLLERDLTNLRGLCASCHSRKTRGVDYSYDLGPDGLPVDPNHPANR